ncbi:hypothetical protein H2200_013451 [Cladophialophora chaetospira]|uniref:F-box domain-containing protein n=1 Tax=Cladophialophora chaetospira TaxID=386627 RepID=A0AA38U9M3_9EURO|nr:hypothetical protein H2200_013451 [Cladophialophora chaetospira]
MAMLDLPQEILANILSFLEPHSIIHFGQSCRAAYVSVGPQNQILWRSAFLHVFDDPNEAWSMMPGKPPLTADRDWDWHAELSRRFLALRAVRSRWCGSDTRAEGYIDALLSILDTAKPALSARDIAKGRIPREDDRYTSTNLQVLSNLAECRDGLESLIHDIPMDGMPRPVTRSRTLLETEKRRPASASRLHVIYGLTNRERIEHKARGAARRKVYDWNLTSEDNEYAPFLRDGSGKVDWPLLEGVMSVIGRNFTMCVEGSLSMPQGFCFSLPYRTLLDPTTPDDWARVSGPWLGTYSFLDYADLFAFNNWEDQLGSRPTLEDEPEDCGDLMRLELRLDESIASDPRLQTTLPVCTDLPVLFFSGLSRGHAGIHRPVIGVRGSASLVPGGREVRWRFLINYGGQDQWQLEGIQPGGVRSGGIFGIWTQCDHEVNGPVGPFCYFPIELCKSTSVVLVA